MNYYLYLDLFMSRSSVMDFYDIIYRKIVDVAVTIVFSLISFDYVTR